MLNQSYKLNILQKGKVKKSVVKKHKHNLTVI